MSLGVIYSPTIHRGELQVTNFDQCFHSVMVIGKCTDVFRGTLLVGGVEWKELCGRIFLWRNLSWGKINSMNGVQDFLALLKKTMNK